MIKPIVRTKVRASRPFPLGASRDPIVKFTGPYRFLSNFAHSPIHIEYRFELPVQSPPPPREVMLDRGDGGGLQKVWMTFTQSDQPDVCGGFAQADSVEHAYQARKAPSYEMFERVLKAKTATDARRLGRSITPRVGWEAERIAVMRELIMLKFQHAHLADLLCQTGTRELVEGNTWGDQFWGAVALPHTPDTAIDEGRVVWVDQTTGIGWEGENWLGRLLMERRSVLQKAAGGSR